MKISQLRLSQALHRPGRDPFLLYNLERYSDRDRPAFFFGLYDQWDIEALMAHRAPAVVRWGGSDTIKALQDRDGLYKAVLSRPETFHVAISPDIAHDLQVLGITPVRIPLCLTNPANWEVKPLGSCVYVYTSSVNPHLYQDELARVIEKKCQGIPFIYGGQNYIYGLPFAKMAREYAKCFIGLRLTTHDGLANNVIELGLCGRFCIWNGELPNAISFRSIEGAVETIKEHSSLIGSSNPGLASLVKQAIQLPKGWDTLGFYTHSKGQAQNKSPTG